MEAITHISSLAWVWQPALAPLQIFAAAAVLVALAVFAHARTFRGRPVGSAILLTMRLGVILALATVLLGPSRIPPRAKKASRPRLLIYADTSASMLTADCDGASRIAFAQDRWLAPDFLGRLGETCEVRTYRFDEESGPLTGAAILGEPETLAAGRISRIADNVREAVQKLPPTSGDVSLLVISDGHDSDAAPMRPVSLLARARGIPVHTVCLGGPSFQRDLVLAAYPEQRYLLRDETGHIVATVHQAGLGDQAATIHMESGGARVTRTVRFRGKRSVTVKLPVRPDKPGLHEYALRVAPLAGETEVGNNAQTVFLEVTQERIRVLLLEGEPFWDTKFIAQSLRKDPRVELTQISHVAPKRLQRIVTRSKKTSAAVPKTARELAEYDVIVLGRGIEWLLSPETAALLPAFVAEGGGHVIFARARAYDPVTTAGRRLGRQIAVLEPVVWGRGVRHNLALQVTPAGRSAPCFAFGAMAPDVGRAVGDLPGLSVMPAIAREKTAGRVLARAVPRGRVHGAPDRTAPPALVSMNYGRGRVVAVLGEGLWQWGILPPELSKLDGIYDVFWSNMIRWLAMGSQFLPGQEAALQLSRSSVRLGDPVLLDVVCKFAPAEGFAPKITVTDPQGRAVTLEPTRAEPGASRLQAAYTPEVPGVYEVVLDCPPLKPARIARKFSVYHVDTERLQASADHQAMRTLAERSGGLSLAAGDPGALPEKLAQLRALREAPRRPEFLWDRAVVLAVLLAWAGAEWLLRKRSGLL